jgi:hypothetical protein
MLVPSLCFSNEEYLALDMGTGPQCSIVSNCCAAEVG